MAKLSPRLARALEDIELNDFRYLPNRAYVTYSVCSDRKSGCGWRGWILEHLFYLHRGEEHQCQIDTSCLCPNCGEPIFRTGAKMYIELKKGKSDPRGTWLPREEELKPGHPVLRKPKPHWRKKAKGRR